MRGNDYSVLTEYTYGSNYIKMEHNACGNIYDVKPSTFLRGHGCPKCFGAKGNAKTTEKFKKEVYELVGDEYTVLGEYTLSRNKIDIKHNKCGNEYQVVANSFLRGNRCPNCNGNKSKHKTTEHYKKEVYDLVGDEYTILGEYINRSTDISIRHNKCKREYQVEPGNFLYGSRCIECYHNSIKLKEEEVKNRIRDTLGELYTLESEYHNSQDKIKLLHKKCGKTFKVRYTDIIQRKSGCPTCNQSLGEQFVSEYLEKVGLEYEFEKKFPDLRLIFELSYDFFVPEINTLIEYQGEQHYRPVNFGNESEEKIKDRYKKQIIRDNMKREYAQEKGMILLEPTFKLDTFKKVEDYLKEKIHYKSNVGSP